MHPIPLSPVARSLNGDSPVPGVVAYRHPSAFPADVLLFLERAERRNVEFGLPWYRNLVNTVYPDHEGIRFYVVRRDAALLAVLPLRAERTATGWNLHSLSNFYTTLYEPVFEAGVAPTDLVPLVSALRREFPGFASLMLAPMDVSAPAWSILLAALRLSGLVAFDYFTHGNWVLPVTGGWASYLAERDGQLRSTIKRMDKKFAAAGGRLEILRTIEAMPAAIAAYETVYRASWKKPEPFPDFIPGLMQTYAASGALRLGLAWLDGQPIAAQLWIVAHGRAVIYKLAYHEDFKAYSTGTLLTARLMEQALDIDQVCEVDYLVGDDPYKTAWMTLRRERRGIVAYNPRSLHGLRGLGYECLGRLVKMARQRWKLLAS